MSRIRVGDLFCVRRNSTTAWIYVQYVGDDSYYGEICRVLRTRTEPPARACDLVAGETWFYVCCPIDVAVDKGLATSLARCEVVEVPVFRKLGDDRYWYLRSENVDKRIGRELPSDCLSVSPYNLVTPLALLDMADDGYEPARDIEELVPSAPSLISRLLTGRSRRRDEPQQATRLTVSVSAAPNARSAVLEVGAELGWVEDRSVGFGELVLGRVLRQGEVISDLTEELMAGLQPLGAAVEDHEVGPLRS